MAVKVFAPRFVLDPLDVCAEDGAVADPKKLTTIMSTKGQVILPKAIRQQRRWDTGTRLLVEDTPEAVLLKPASVFAQTRPEDVFASLPYSGAPKTMEDMEAGIVAEAKRRHAGG